MGKVQNQRQNRILSTDFVLWQSVSQPVDNRDNGQAIDTWSLVRVPTVNGQVLRPWSPKDKSDCSRPSLTCTVSEGLYKLLTEGFYLPDGPDAGVRKWLAEYEKSIKIRERISF